MKYLIGCLLFALFAGPLCAQEPTSRGDALQQLRQAQAATLAGDSAKARQLIDAAKTWATKKMDTLVTAWAEQLAGELEFAAGNRGKAIDAFTAALDAFTTLKNQQGMAVAHLNLGRLLLADNKPGEALPHQREAAELFEKLNRNGDVAAALEDQGAAHKALGKLEEAQSAWQKAQALYRQASPARPAAELRVLAELAACCESLGNAEQALKHLAAALKLAEELKDAAEEARLHHSLGVLYHKNSQLDEALKEYEAALKFYSANNNHQAAEASTRCNLGALLQDQGKPQQALDELNKALDLAARERDTVAQARALYNIALVYEGQAQEAKAIESYEKALAFRRQGKDIAGTVKILDSLALLYASQNKPDKAKQCRDEAEKLRKP